LQLNTSGNINILNYGEKNQYQQEKTNLDWQAYAKDVKDKQYRVGVGFNHTFDKYRNESTTQQSSELNGGVLTVNAGRNVTAT
ncbi:hemagglutinin repeat-containing protein, partial [Xenorhabdus bovienii]|uniref:hemagglutinin repeat-containing protein n=1 Tax=Xenorhabdus bovienii TaxID=40576 RepID=UPI0023B2CFBE